MAIFPVYCDVPDFLNNAAAAIELGSLIGGNAVLHTAYPAGSPSLQVDAASSPYATTTFGAGQAWILDGLQSEVVTVLSETGTTLTLAGGTQVAHSAGVSISSAGTAGCLATAILDACRKAETFCRQGPAGVTGLTGGNATALIAGPYSVGATSFTVQSGAGLTAGSARILDGANSELVTISGVSGTTVTLASPGLAFAHSAGATITMAPTGDRTLYALPRSETYRLATMTAHIDSDQTLVVSPYHFPVASVTSALLQLGTWTGNAVDLSNMVLPDDGRMLMVPFVSWSNSNPLNQWLPNPALRDPNLWLKLSYTAGPTPLAFGGTPQLLLVPDDIKRAVYWYTMSVLAFRQNPLGAASVRMGDVQHQFELRGGNQKQQSSLLIKEAEGLLAPYRRC
jgi:hypothetical protein